MEMTNSKCGRSEDTATLYPVDLGNTVLEVWPTMEVYARARVASKKADAGVGLEHKTTATAICCGVY
jgi:hypothetical protein